MNKEKLEALLDTSRVYGFERDVPPSVVLGGFLKQFWFLGGSDIKNQVSRYLIPDEEMSEIDAVLKISDESGSDKKQLIDTLKEFLRQILWTNPESVIKRWEDKNKEKRDTNKLLKTVNWHPLDKRFLGDITYSRFGNALYCGLVQLKDNNFAKLQDQIKNVDEAQEAEVKIVATLFDKSWNQRQKDNPRCDADDTAPSDLHKYSSLFRQMGEDLSGLLKLDTNMMSKSRFLLYLERLVNLYALLYYMRVICEKTDSDNGKPPSGDFPLILPLCSNEAEDGFKEYSTICFQRYRQKADTFWRKYLKERIQKNVNSLGCGDKDASTILDAFLKNESEIFRITKGNTEAADKLVCDKPDELSKNKAIKTLKDELTESLNKLKQSPIKLSPVDQFTEAFLSYNLKGSRTLARLRRIMHSQGPGAGIVAPETDRVKHFHLKPELLELLVILFSSRYRNQPSRLDLQHFVSEIRERYGIILGPSENWQEALKKQDLPIPKHGLLKKNFDHLTTMLRNLDMLESLSDTAKYVKCPFLWQ